MFTSARLVLIVVILPLFVNHGFTVTLPFKRAVELAARNGVTRAVSETGQDKVCQAYVGAIPQVLVGSDLDYSVELPKALSGAADVMSPQELKNQTQKSSGQTSQTERRHEYPAEQDQHCNAVLDAAIAYSQLSWVNLHLDVQKHQHEFAARLVNAEKKRVVAGVDGEVSLVRARLLEAKTRMRSANLEGKVLELRKNLADLTGLPEYQIETIPESIPPLPETEELSATEQTIQPRYEVGLFKLQESVKELIAARDAAQLVFLLVQRDAIRTGGLVTTKLGEQLASQVREDEKFGELLDATFELQEAQFELLDATGELEKWATAEEADKPVRLQTQSSGGLISNTSQLGATLSAVPTKGAIQSKNSSFKDAVAPSSVKTILVLPSDGVLTVRGCRQLAAVAVSDGRGKDVTSVVKWSSSNESIAIVSTSGLVTGLRSGHVTITASLDGVSRLRPITITEGVPILGK